MNRTEAREYINSKPNLVLDLLTKSKGNQYNCPVCHSGEHGGNNSDGALTYYPDSNRFLCFACGDEGLGGKGQDILGTLRKIWNCTESEVFARSGIVIDSNSRQTSPRTPHNAASQPAKGNYTQKTEKPQRAAQSVKPQYDNTEYYAKCNARLKQAPEAIKYLFSRGISLETANNYNLGYDPEWRSPKAKRDGKNPPASPRIIMPTTANHYVARDIRPDVKSYAKMNEGEAAIFNLNALYDSSNETIFICEGFFDALSIITVGYPAIALNSTSNAGKLIEQLEKKRTEATIVISSDNDTAGQKCAEKLKEGFKRLNISYVTADICGGYKDPNEALQKDRERFLEAVTNAQQQTAARPDNVEKYIDMFMSGDISKFKESGNRKTGFANLDKEAGGLYSGLYVVAAISSLGKTTFCTQMADQLAEMGEEVLFFSLEQSRLELVSKSIARRTAQNDIETAVNSLSIRRGYLTQHVLKAADEYKQAVGDRLSIIEGNFACNISFIGDYIRKYIAKTGKKPIIFIDYLQILQPEKDDRGRTQTTKETVDNTVTELKRISREHGLTVFVISSVNRANYLTPIDFESLKESGGIEYTADVVWGLQLQILRDPIFNQREKIKEKREKVRAEKKKSPRKIELVCLKNRYGISDFSVYFDYYPASDMFVIGKPTFNQDDEEESTVRI